MSSRADFHKTLIDAIEEATQSKMSPEERKRRKQKRLIKSVKRGIGSMAFSVAAAALSSYLIMIFMGAFWIETGLLRPLGFWAVLWMLLLIESAAHYLRHALGLSAK